jgi:hypothetical protein
VGIYCYDPHPENINRFIGRRDNTSIGDLVGIAFDTYHDQRNSYEFNVMAGGNRTDITMTDGGGGNRSWDAVWEARTHVSIEESSWTAEFKIPFSQLRYNFQNETGIWGLHIRRSIYATGENLYWSFIPQRNNGRTAEFGEMHGMFDLPKPRGFEFLPYVLGRNVNAPAISGSPYQTGSEWLGDVGLDAKIALRDFTLDATINPDFGQVQLDPSVMNLTAYETRYSEVRPFFLEGSQIFNYGGPTGSDAMFYSRRMGAAPPLRPRGIDNETSFAETVNNAPILGAVKLTGTNTQGLTVGLLESITRRTSVLTMRDGVESREVLAPLTNYTLARVRQNWNNGNALLGGIFTSVNRRLDEPRLQDALVKDAFTGGIDYIQYFKNRLYILDAKVIVSSLNGSKEAIQAIQESSVHYFQRVSSQDYLQVDPNLTSMAGTGGSFRLGRVGNSALTINETFSWSSPKLNLNDMGFMREADSFRNETEIAYRQPTAWAGLRSTTITMQQTNRWDFGGLPTHNDIMLRWNATGMNRMSWSARGTYVMNNVNVRMLRGGPNVRFNPYFTTNLSFNTDRSKSIVFDVGHSGDYRDELKENSFSAEIDLRLGNRVLISGETEYSRGHNSIQYITNTRPVDSAETAAPGYIVGNLNQTTYGITLSAQFNITPDLSIQFYGSPFTSMGKYDRFKIAENPQSHKQSERFYTFSESETSFDTGNNNYTVSKNGGEAYRFRNPDFSFNEFRSNLVLRWEYMRGSTIFFVWEHQKSDRTTDYISNWGTNLDRMFGLPSTNVFMLKINYWFAL